MTEYTFTVTARFGQALTEQQADSILSEMAAQLEGNDDHPEGVVVAAVSNANGAAGSDPS